MAITKFRWGMGGTDESAGFGKKVWFKRTTDPADVEEFATRESSEEQVRKDYQNLFNQLQWYINEKLTNEIELYAKQIAEQAVEEAGWQAAIPDGTITAAKLASNAAETAKIKDGAVTSAKIASGAIETAKIADSAVTAAKIGSSAVTTVKIADGAVTADKLATGAVTAESLGAASITSGDYVGDGQSGAEHPTTLNFTFAPKILFINQAYAGLAGTVVAFNGTSSNTVPSLSFDCAMLTTTAYKRIYVGSGIDIYAKKTANGKGVMFYSTVTTSNGAVQQMNSNGQTYHYVAIG